MPTYIYSCQHPDCQPEFEEFHSMSESAKLVFCPHCKEAGRGDENPVQRLIALSSKGVVTETVDEFKANLPNEKRKILQQAATSENFASNVVGEKVFNSNYNKLYK